MFTFSPLLRAGTLSFGPPEHLATLPWATTNHPGIPTNGIEWLVVDDRGRFWLEADLDFGLYTSNGKYLKTVNPIDKRMNFYGFASMEALPEGRIALLQRLETRQEQIREDNFQLRSKPGSRLIIVGNDGSVLEDRQELDPLEPHSDYDLENGNIYSIHPDGTFDRLDSIGPCNREKGFDRYAAIADVTHWNDHVRTLPVFHSENGSYHDIKGRLHVEKGARSSLMGRQFVEGLAPMAERNGKIYDEVVCNHRGDFVNTVFIEDLIHKDYSMVDLVSPDPDLEIDHDHALFVDPKGDIYEGVAEKDGYRIYEWKVLD